MFERCLYFNINALARRINRIWEEAYQGLGLSPAHAYVLRTVLAEPGISNKDLAVTLQLEKSTVSRFVNALQQKGMLQGMRVGGDDRRRMRLFPTVEARRIQHELEQTGERLYQQMLGAMESVSLPELVRDVRKASNNLQEHTN
jgi:MarR family transcriptional regulator, organic hydroperoxide resistance regulator